MNPVQRNIAAAQMKEQLFNERFQQALKDTPFPVEKITPTWAENALRALRFASIIGLGISPQEWNCLLGPFEESCQTVVRSLDLYQFACLSNNLQKRTPDELGLRLLAYGDLMVEADELVIIWQELTKGIRDRLDADLEAEIETKLAAEEQTTAATRPDKSLKVK